MLQVDFLKLGILCFFVGFAAFVDSIAGGGGIISAPAYLALGFPPHISLGTAKFSSILSTSVAIYRYGFGKCIAWREAGIAMVASFFGSLLGANLALMMSGRTLQLVMLTVLPFVAVFIVFRKQKLEEPDQVKKEITGILPKCAAIGFLIGIYEGLLGPGTGTFLIIAFSTVVGFDLLTASGTAKVVNIAGTVGAVITFLLSGKVLLVYAIPTAACGMFGSWLGSGLALKNGAKIIRPMMIVVVTLLFIKIAYDFFI